MNIDGLVKGDIRHDIKRLEQLLATNIFHLENHRHPLVESAFIEVCILLNDLLGKNTKYSSRINFTDDIIIIPNEVTDITDSVSKVRNAVCHISSAIHIAIADTTIRLKASFNVVHGKTPPFNLGFGYIVQGDYEDDTAFYYGLHRLYLNRHIYRAFEEAKKNLLPLL